MPTIGITLSLKQVKVIVLWCQIFFHITVTSWWRWRFKSPVIRLFLKRLFRRRTKKTSKLRVTGLCEGNPPVNGGFPSQRANNVGNVSIWWLHHEFHLLRCDLSQSFEWFKMYWYTIPSTHTLRLNYCHIADDILTFIFLNNTCILIQILNPTEMYFRWYIQSMRALMV